MSRNPKHAPSCRWVQTNGQEPCDCGRGVQPPADTKRG